MRLVEKSVATSRLNESVCHYLFRDALYELLLRMFHSPTGDSKWVRKMDITPSHRIRLTRRLMEDDLVIRKIKNKREYYYELTQKGVDLAMAIENILTILGEVDIQKKVEKW